MLELISRDDETEDNGILVKAETGDSAEMAKTDKIKSESEEKSGSLTVTVSKNKKGRSVADSDAVSTVVPAKRDSDVMFWLLSYQGLRIDRSLVY